MLTVNAEVGSATANSYVTAAECDTYHEGSVYSDTWADASVLDKNKAVVSATRILDERVTWIGTIKTETQALYFPRYGLIYRNGYEVPNDIVPQFVKNATMELARLLLETDITQPNNVTELKLGSMSVSIGKEDVQSLPDSVVQMVKFWIENSNGHARLIRC